MAWEFPAYPPPHTPEANIYARFRELNELSRTECVYWAQVGDSISNFGSGFATTKPKYNQFGINYGFPALMQQALQVWGANDFYNDKIGYQYYNAKYAFNYPDSIGASLQRVGTAGAALGLGLGLQGNLQSPNSERFKVRRGTAADLVFNVQKTGLSYDILVDGAVRKTVVNAPLGWKSERITGMSKGTRTKNHETANPGSLPGVVPVVPNEITVAEGFHDVRVKFRQAGTAVMAGIAFHDGDHTRGWKIVDGSRSGITTAQYAPAYSGTKGVWATQLPLMSFDGKSGPDVVWLTTATNDYNMQASVHGAQMRDLAMHVRKYAPYATIVFAIPPRIYSEMPNIDTWARYIHQHRLIAADMPNTIVAPFAGYIPQGGAADQDIYWFDSLHPTNLGYERMRNVAMNHMKGAYFIQNGGTIPAKSGIVRPRLDGSIPEIPDPGTTPPPTPTNPTLTYITPPPGSRITRTDQPFRLKAPGADTVWAMSGGNILDYGIKDPNNPEFFEFKISYLDMQGYSGYRWNATTNLGGVTRGDTVAMTVAEPEVADNFAPTLGDFTPSSTTEISGSTLFRIQAGTKSPKGIAKVALRQGGSSIAQMINTSLSNYDATINVSNSAEFNPDISEVEVLITGGNGVTASQKYQIKLKQAVVKTPPDVYLNRPQPGEVVRDTFVAEISATYFRGMSHANLYSDGIYLGPTELDDDGLYRGLFDISNLPAGVVKADGRLRINARAVNLDGLAGESAVATISVYKELEPGVPVRNAGSGFVTEAKLKETIDGLPTGGGGGTSGVSSVNTRTGAVTLAKSDVGLSNVDNTSDANKPISLATQTALGARPTWDEAGIELEKRVLKSDNTTAMAAKADLIGGVIPTSQIPSIALGTSVGVASQAAMLALTTTQVQPGDLAVRADGAGTFMLIGANPATLSNWMELSSKAAVTSVNGQVGTVVLGKTDFGLGNVDNTSDANKPISAATQSALSNKAAFDHTHDASSITGGLLAPARLGLNATDQIPVQLSSGALGGVAVASTAVGSTVARRTAGGQLMGATATDAGHLPNKAQLDAAIATTVRLVLLDPGVTIAPSTIFPGTIVAFR
ncbi:putative SGNH hydrolase [Clavibacter phage CMP1]|uniref:Putative SGNH hydrolase n=1 Tax=Clavibacter phage CMP1 TaxID=686439 RepID=D0U203_9CAUD|nr:minor tail protein [Clavibacter phage CMP1]ACY35915.1 putative SGNH hydrolase [Clavibacter phage CMP1]